MAEPETPFGRVLRDALLFAEMAAGEEYSFRHPSGYEIHATDVCMEFAKALGIECGSDEYFKAIDDLATSPIPALSLRRG